jgi:hypothetical protein
MNNVIHKDVEPDDTSIEVIHVKRGSGKAKKTKIKKNKKEPKSVDQEHNLFDSEEIKSQELDTSTEIEHHEQYQKIDKTVRLSFVFVNGWRTLIRCDLK